MNATEPSWGRVGRMHAALYVLIPLRWTILALRPTRESSAPFVRQRAEVCRRLLVVRSRLRAWALT